jgi:hypothetical protein
MVETSDVFEAGGNNLPGFPMYKFSGILDSLR